MIDRQGRGDILWQDFYLVVAILISLKDRNEKQFIFRHSKIVFDLMDEDGGGTISADEFKVYFTKVCVHILTKSLRNTDSYSTYLINPFSIFFTILMFLATKSSIIKLGLLNRLSSSE